MAKGDIVFKGNTVGINSESWWGFEETKLENKTFGGVVTRRGDLDTHTGDMSFPGTFSAFAISVKEVGRSMANFTKAVRRFEDCPYCDGNLRPTETLPGNRHCPTCKGFR